MSKPSFAMFLSKSLGKEDSKKKDVGEPKHDQMEDSAIAALIKAIQEKDTKAAKEALQDFLEMRSLPASDEEEAPMDREAELDSMSGPEGL